MHEKKAEWFEDHTELVAFAHWLADNGHFDGANRRQTADNVLYYFEKPWKWTPEYEGWKAEPYTWCVYSPKLKQYIAGDQWVGDRLVAQKWTNKLEAEKRAAEIKAVVVEGP